MTLRYEDCDNSAERARELVRRWNAYEASRAEQAAHAAKLKCGETSFRHEPNYSGDVTIRVASVQVTVPIDDLLEFGAAVIRHRLIDTIEKSSDVELWKDYMEGTEGKSDAS